MTEPTPEDLARCLRADLCLCEAARPWEPLPEDRGELRLSPRGERGTVWVLFDDDDLCAEFHDHMYFGCRAEDYARLLVEARSGWPAAIRRALAAEAEVRRLRGQVEGHCRRIAEQSELLSRLAEKDVSP